MAILFHLFSLIYRYKTYLNSYWKQSLDKALTALSAFSYKASVLKKGLQTGANFYRLLMQTTFWNPGREQI